MIIKPKNWVEFHRQKYLLQNNINNRPDDISQKRFNYLVKIINFKPNDVVLDFGCGSAYLYSLVGQKVKKYIGVDSCFECIEELRNKYPETEFHSKIPNQHFTKIVANSVLMYLKNGEELDKYIRMFHELLPPGGLLFVGEMPINQEYKRKSKGLFKRLKMFFSPNKYLTILPRTLYYQPQDFLKFCHGFKGTYFESKFLSYKRFDYFLTKLK